MWRRTLSLWTLFLVMGPLAVIAGEDELVLNPEDITEVTLIDKEKKTGEVFYVNDLIIQKRITALKGMDKDKAAEESKAIAKAIREAAADKNNEDIASKRTFKLSEDDLAKVKSEKQCGWWGWNFWRPLFSWGWGCCGYYAWRPAYWGWSWWC